MTNTERKRRNLTDAADCQRCGVEEESLDHIFRRCEIATDCWAASSPPTDFASSFHLPLSTWMEKACINNQTCGLGLSWRIIFPYILWNIWKNRNDLVFKNTLLPATMIVKKQRLKRWKLNVYSSNGLLPGRTLGLPDGLIIAKTRGFTHIIAETDSEALVQALDNGPRGDPSGSTLILDCYSLMNQFQEIKTTHVSREGNQCADFLANMGQNAAWGTTVLDHPPDGLSGLLNRDAMGSSTCRRR
ncbi:uncharacterized protein LOC116024424 [Ipomoea triloba]|uniref:uncharacterized protein LOC116024424 n=1 Tax=Ipomoea triloba TaxID=35885 RepID=UPI00125DCC59|nr:uncharacterized protein LOC116024424 [Ipomoea triloba]